MFKSLKNNSGAINNPVRLTIEGELDIAKNTVSRRRQGNWKNIAGFQNGKGSVVVGLRYHGGSRTRFSYAHST